MIPFIDMFEDFGPGYKTLADDADVHFGKKIHNVMRHAVKKTTAATTMERASKDAPWKQIF